MKTTEGDVEAFLKAFKAKMRVFEVVCIDRDENLQALFDLEINAIKRKQILMALEVKDFYKGPSKDSDGGPDLWEFGKLVNKKEVYIKLTLGIENRAVICVSFHVSKRAIVYPFKIE